MPHSYTLPAVTTLTVSLWLLGCGDDDGSGPEPALVSGLYETTTTADRPATCTPSDAADVLEVVMGSIDTRERIRVVEDGGEITLTVEHIEGLDGTPVNIDSATSIVAPIDADGNVNYELDLHGQFTLEEGTFFDSTTIAVEGSFDRDAEPITMALSATGTQVFREGAADGPVFATCVQNQSTAGARTGP